MRGIFDEIILVDTGSKDGTIEIARSFGAQVFEFVWIDSFAAARNEALSHATGDYVFWLDADDVVEPGEREKLLALLASLVKRAPREAIPASSALEGEPVGIPPSGGFLRSSPDRNGPPDGGTPTGAAYVVRCACDPSPDGTGRTVVDHVRLFPLRDDVRWSYRVHEQILPGLRRANVPTCWTDLTVRHTGYVDHTIRARKLERDFKILERELVDRKRSQTLTLWP